MNLYCPQCDALAHQDHNSFWCDGCAKLWPKGAGHENELQAADLRNLARGSHGLVVGSPFDSATRSFRDGPLSDPILQHNSQAQHTEK